MKALERQGAAVARAAGERLARYRARRNFALTPEPASEETSLSETRSFVIQKHWASRLHYDFRLELDGLLLSWAVPKGPSYDPTEKRMAVHVEDHPVTYGEFEGTIPPRQYGAGKVIVWDRGTWEPVGDPHEGMAKGKLVFRLHGHKLAGLWELVRIAKPGDKQDLWMLFKKRDAWARPTSEYDVIAALPDSVMALPLGLVEEREPRGQPVRPSRLAKETADPAIDLSLALPARLPKSLAPQLAMPASGPMVGEGWALEPKWDGYRLLARIEDGKARLFTRNGHDWTAKLPMLAREVEALNVNDSWLDGEIVVLDSRGVPDFNALQNAMDANGEIGIVYYLFDAPFFGGQDLRKVPLSSRRVMVRRMLEGQSSERLRFSQDFDAPADPLLQAACALGLEGLVAKRLDSIYSSRRTATWLKYKCQQRQEFVVVGFATRAGTPREVGTLMLACHEGGQLRYAGKVGTGWTSQAGQRLYSALTALEVSTPMFEGQAAGQSRWAGRNGEVDHWVQPRLVVEVSFTEWTPDGMVRHPVFKGIRSDKTADQVVREPTATVPSALAPAGAGTKASSTLKVTHPERVVDPSTGIKKLELVRYYESVAQWMLPHVAHRPLSMVRAPDGISGELFFQKHLELRMPGVEALDTALWPGHSPLVAVVSAEGLVAAAQMNVIEFHTWNSTAKHINEPNRIVFDLDPGEGVPWKRVQEAALLTRTMLEALGLQCWLKTSGGKGLHVVVPLAPKLDFPKVKGFSQRVVEHMAKTLPHQFAAKSGAANRVGKVYIDFLRNGFGQTTAAAFSVRARPGLGVSMPVSWDDLATLKSGAQWTVSSAREHLSFQAEDPWTGYWKCQQTLAKATNFLDAGK